MSEIPREKAFDRVVDLVIHLDNQQQGWVRRFMLVEAGLGIAVGTILGWKGTQPDAVILTLIVLLAAFGILFAVVISLLMERLQRWQAFYVEAVKRTEGDDPLLYKHDFRLPGPGFRTAYVTSGIIVVFGWFAFLAILFTELQPGLDPTATSLWLGAVAVAISAVALALSAFVLWRSGGRKQANKPLQPPSGADHTGVTYEIEEGAARG